MRCNGMFALAVWDRHERRLHLARDRFGEKPLYYGWMGGVLLFGSELKALRAHRAFDAELDRDALALYFRHNCVPAPYCDLPGDRPSSRPATVVTFEERTTPGTAAGPGGVLVAGRRGRRRRPRPLSCARGRRPRRARLRVSRDAVGIRMHADVASGGVPLGRDRLVAGRGADAGAAHVQGEDLHHRLRRRRLRRGGRCPARSPTIWAPITTSCL